MFNMYRRIRPYVIITTTVYELERGYIVVGGMNMVTDKSIRI